MPVGELISQSSYIRERIAPQPGDEIYLHLSDLYMAMQRVSTHKPIRVLDFGCGGSPYRSLFPNAEYVRADIAGTPDVDFEIKSGEARGELPIEDGYFDLILSSQVLEHVLHPADYLAESFRLLREGGQLVLTTHGTFEDHGCPHDYYRWTSDGLQLVIAAAGFTVCDTFKMTTGPRAAVFILEQYFPQSPRRTRFGWSFSLLRRCIYKATRKWHQWCDATMSDFRVVMNDCDKHRIYIGVGCVASKGKQGP